MKKNNEIILSVVIISYKQKKYIKDAIESVLSQKTKYKYELILSDDYSCDGTLEIMYEYQKKYPDIIRVIDRGKNVGTSMNQLDSCSKSNGKYITLLEGDDYWCDDKKIEKQINFLESHPEFIAYSHLQEGRNMKNEIMGYFPQKLKDDFIINNIEEYLNGKKFSETATVYKNIYLDKNKIADLKKLFSYDSIVSDSQICTYLSYYGKIYVSKEAMMVYRMRNSEGETNYNSTHNVSEIQLTYLKIHKNLEEFFKFTFSNYKKIEDDFTVGVSYDLLHFDFKHLKLFLKETPKRYKKKLILLYPFNCLKIGYKIVKKRVGNK